MRWLVAVDLEDHADKVLEEALSWVGEGPHVVDLIYVDHRPVRLDFIEDPVMREAAERQHHERLAEHRRRLDALTARIPDAQRGETFLEIGRPADEILERAAGYDCVAIATHGRTGLRRLWMGSVAEKVLRFSPAPVLVLRVDRP